MDSLLRFESTIKSEIIKNNYKEFKMTASLGNFISSLVAGGLVVSAIGVALIIISKSDRVTRGDTW